MPVDFQVSFILLAMIGIFYWYQQLKVITFKIYIFVLAIELISVGALTKIFETGVSL